MYHAIRVSFGSKHHGRRRRRRRRRCRRRRRWRLVTLAVDDAAPGVATLIDSRGAAPSSTAVPSSDVTGAPWRPIAAAVADIPLPSPTLSGIVHRNRESGLLL